MNERVSRHSNGIRKLVLHSRDVRNVETIKRNLELPYLISICFQPWMLFLESFVHLLNDKGLHL